MKYFVSDNGSMIPIEVEYKSQLPEAIKNTNSQLFEAMAQTYISGDNNLVVILKFAVSEADFTVEVQQEIFQYQNIYTRLETTDKETLKQVNPGITDIVIENLEYEANKIAEGRISTIKRWNNVQNFKKELEQLTEKYDITCKAGYGPTVVFEDNAGHNISATLLKE